MTDSAILLFLTVTLVSLQCVIVVFSDHTHLLFYQITMILSEVLANSFVLDYYKSHKI